MLIIDYRRYLVVLLGIGIVLYEVVVFKLIFFKFVQLYYPIIKTMSSQLRRYLSSPYFAVNPDEESAIKMCQRNSTS